MKLQKAPCFLLVPIMTAQPKRLTASVATPENAVASPRTKAATCNAETEMAATRKAMSATTTCRSNSFQNTFL